ncbi:MAG TPA: Asp-tRNA(Asn)/Glu-tRNA(Gln) amidotransferase subunit GatA [Oligoflexus sp.]|uniref:Asp-tRNA(Asn)/Glu-tRNA(Gln) amidotransferase subunit GatA n=1 Tax=Oligoflexus sp. TaxID=1971216 RepID=UPI002D7FA8BE|nr:Asp-tRNA(Asn)/Glu-tRNA(Gln) amidotransferase subunit GatA [Oligoflexus sp.]HET9238887.1 Asp-tRNA(Asn)/Glu-tRNA(Gln) amidotransferase subunit GatA [Oligoflexus sp.]
MSALEPLALSASQVAQEVNAGSLKAHDVAAAYARRVENLHRELNTHIEWDKEAVLNEVDKQLAYIEAARYAQKSLPLAGVPIAIKDNIMVDSQTVSCGSQLLRNHRAAYDATVIQKLKAAGALLFGRTNMDEFAMGSSCENSSYGPTINPWNRRHVAGGSSGGSAAAVAARLTPLALGSDTGGSVRQPASFCGVVGLKPTYGRVSRYGLIAYGSSLDQIGTFATSVQDTALLYEVIAGHDPADSTSARIAAPQGSLASTSSLKGKRIAIIKEFMSEGLDEDVRTHFDQALDVYRAAGATVETVSLPHLLHCIPVYYIIATAEASSNLARFDGIRYGVRSQKPGLSLRELYTQSRSEGFGREVKQRIMLGTYVLSSGYYDAYYAKANRIREMIRREIQGVFEQGFDLIASPTSPTTAFELGQKTQDSLAMYLSDIYTLAANLAGIPALSQPIGLCRKGLPIGMQLMAPAFGEETLLRSAQVYEQQINGTEKFRPRI